MGRQYTGSTSKITNCQIGVFGAYVSERRHAFIDRALYLPKDWTSKPERMTRAHVPDNVIFATKPALASQMIERCLDAEEFDCSRPELWTRGLLIRRNIADRDIAYFTTLSPKGTTMQK